MGHNMLMFLAAFAFVVVVHVAAVTDVAVVLMTAMLLLIMMLMMLVVHNGFVRGERDYYMKFSQLSLKPLEKGSLKVWDIIFTLRLRPSL